MVLSAVGCIGGREVGILPKVVRSSSDNYLLAWLGCGILDVGRLLLWCLQNKHRYNWTGSGHYLCAIASNRTRV